MEDVFEFLDSPSPNETKISKDLRQQALNILQSPTPDPADLQTLLSTIFRPLFSKSQHPSLTSTGRKNQLSNQPSFPSRFSSTDDSIFSPPPAWKTHWTVPLLTFILSQYTKISAFSNSTSSSRQTLESHFHLLVPPILNLIDDSDAQWKAHGCDLLTSLCELLFDTESDILKRTGLTEVFIEALEGCFHYLPSLTPETESLIVLEAMYPAYLGLVRARYGALDRLTTAEVTRKNGISGNGTRENDFENQLDPKVKEEEEQEERITIVPATKKMAISQKPLPPSPLLAPSIVSSSRPNPKQPDKPLLTPVQISNETSQRTKHLSNLLRHSLLHSISHLSSSTPNSPASTTSIPLTTFLLSQIPLITSQMHVYASIHLQVLIPLLCGVLRDPFVNAAPEMLSAAIDAVEGVVGVCWARVKERWWIEILGGIVEAWLNLSDDGKQKEEVSGLIKKLEGLVQLLGDVVGKEEFGLVVGRLAKEEEELEELFVDMGQVKV